ncbi:cystin-1 [Trichosurus vulpecula]|uniref:cystin-1 n=1 Tax=Trichosurus vulpecula TaxID=9337 RepID=UPI00186AF942|nr:cystin-1 [Trichosurus vulpecula]
MGSGSSRSRRVRRQLRSPDRNPRVPGVQELGDGKQGTEACQEEEDGKDGQEEGSKRGAHGDSAVQDSEFPADGEEKEPESESLLLDQVLAESEAWDPTFEPWPSRASHSRPLPNPHLGGAPRSQANLNSSGERKVSPVQSTQDIENNNNFETSTRSSKRPERQTPILYDCSEEELMASIEREYGR